MLIFIMAFLYNLLVKKTTKSTKLITISKYLTWMMEMEGAATECKGLVITTRGLGLAACDLCYVAASAGVAAPVYAMYRVFLGVAEAKLNACSKHLEGPMRALQHEYKVTPDMLDAPLSVPILPALIKHIIDAIDVITVGGTTYCPFVAAQKRDAAGELDPRPENLLLSSLRETVVTLSSPETSDLHRSWFKMYCPIPGAVWDEDDLLKNADEIIPEGYDWKKDLEGDMWPVHMFLISMQQKYPSMAAGPLSPTGARVSLAALISSWMVALLGEEPAWVWTAPPVLLRQAYEVRDGAHSSSKRVIGTYSIALMRRQQVGRAPRAAPSAAACAPAGRAPLAGGAARQRHARHVQRQQVGPCSEGGAQRGRVRPSSPCTNSLTYAPAPARSRSTSSAGVPCGRCTLAHSK
ncbi:hypothetical protein MSG28_011523 [Choristoneura fumiferana]|uniref:Uncharacterized protein n=2 Tax=Choristoneura fumiferana TaxID=7141 RepID=A0ACC0JNK9_CHOFU|nr:hypothetical protein MSG28_011523 [Choristoneura fumiferana]